jgi:hypothetical protein
LIKFLNLHESCVAIFSAIVKSEGIDVEDIFVKIPNIFTAFNTSFIHYTQCKNCDMSLKIDISEYDFTLPKIKMKCQSCQRVMNTQQSIFNPLIQVQKDDIIRFLNSLSETEIFFSDFAYSCVYCSDPYTPIADYRKVDLVCPECKNIRYVEPLFVLEDDIAELIHKKHGYWLEWYIWKQLEEYHPEHSLIFSKKTHPTSKFEVDVCLIIDDKLVLIECKDTSNIDDIFDKFHLISEVVDKYVLYSTSKIDESKLHSCSSTLKCKDFVYVLPNEINKIKEIIEGR